MDAEQTYYAVVGGYSSRSGAYSLTMNMDSLSPDEYCIYRGGLRGNSSTGSYCNLNASPQVCSDDPTILCGASAGSDVEVCDAATTPDAISNELSVNDCPSLCWGGCGVYCTARAKRHRRVKSGEPVKTEAHRGP